MTTWHRAVARGAVGAVVAVLAVFWWIERHGSQHFEADLPVALEPYAVAALLGAAVWVVVVDFRWREIDHEVTAPAWALALAWSDEPLVLAGLSTTMGALVAAAAWQPDRPRERYDPFIVVVPAIFLTWLAVDTVAALVAGGGLGAVLAWRYYTRASVPVIAFGDVTVIMLGTALLGWPPPEIVKLAGAPAVPVVVLLLVNLWLAGKTKAVRMPAAPVILPPFVIVFVLKFAGVL